MDSGLNAELCQDASQAQVLILVSNHVATVNFPLPNNFPTLFLSPSHILLLLSNNCYLWPPNKPGRKVLGNNLGRK